jgi:hypothetical protein
MNAILDFLYRLPNITTMTSSSSSSPQHRRAKLGFYMYAWACEVFSCVSVAVFLPILLERELVVPSQMNTWGVRVGSDVGFAGWGFSTSLELARSHGYLEHDILRPCLQPDGQLEGGSCAVKIGWTWVDTASFR